ncbi:hypothetical protein ARTSIC4J27_219 [Pseudarthrobacter siccitolerans]|uniref:DUF7455 domain-containing protein n=1 Tax=Pseudarthrobacter siccitolerans TaxID=861266 RepID=A0A024GWJ4_9MICC|nr:hypothetical protein [Pseudarthrobacter siccitolerans]CCQ44295.1 hypothetical protein ARTSIC4J27_219 [Pseudarthrobacter siccitolerans]
MKIPVEAPASEPTKVVVKSSNLAPATLTNADRCDKCGIASRAYVAVMIAVSREGLLPLYFCAHHYNEYEPILREKAVMTVDERWHLEASVKAQKSDVPAYLNTVRRGGI